LQVDLCGGEIKRWVCNGYHWSWTPPGVPPLAWPTHQSPFAIAALYWKFGGNPFGIG